jgi:hypothetical protein
VLCVPRGSGWSLCIYWVHGFLACKEAAIIRLWQFWQTIVYILRTRRPKSTH